MPGIGASPNYQWSWLDPIAELLVAADDGDLDAERSLIERYRRDDGLHPGLSVQQASPFGDELVDVDLRRPDREVAR